MKEIKKRSGEIDLTNTGNKEQDNKLLRLEREKNDIRFEMIKAQNSIVLLLQQGKISPFIANKSDKLITNSDNVRNERDASEKQNFSEKLASMNINYKGRKSEKIFERETAMSRGL